MTLTHILVDFENVQPSAADIALVRGDALRLAIFRGPGQMKYAADVAEAYDRAKALLRKSEPFVWNATNVSRVLREKVINLCTAYKARVRVVYFEPPIPVIRERNAGRAKKVPARVWERLFDKLDVPTEAEAHFVEYRGG